MRAILMSGPAGSGKSTWAENKRLESQASGNLPYQIVSSDKIRFEKFGAYKISPKEEKQVIPAMMEEIKLYSAGGFSVIVDVAICKNKSRRKWFNRLKQYYDDIELVIINASLETCVKQDAGRDRHVPVEVITDMCNMLEEPTEEMKQMFSKITVVERN